MWCLSGSGIFIEYISAHSLRLTKEFEFIMADLYLASQSPRRRELLAQLGVNFEALSVNVVEQRQPGEAPADYVQRLACEKAVAGWKQSLAEGKPARPVLGADTIGLLNTSGLNTSGQNEEMLLEKPVDQRHAHEMLTMMSGRSHEVLTAVALCQGDRMEVCRVRTQVTFRVLSDAEIAAYWYTGEPQDKAGGYGIQGKGGAFVECINGSYSAVVGLPLAQTAQLLDRFEVLWWASGSSAV